MDGNGIMDEIRELLSQGISAPEIARQGYASSTVYPDLPMGPHYGTIAEGWPKR